jgi:hypothetical protein
MNTRLKNIPQWTQQGRVAQRGVAFVAALAFGLLNSICPAASFVYETPTEFISNGDFNGDGRLDAVVLDKATGNARIGYQDISGAITWAAPVASRVPQAGALAVGRFAQTNRDAIAVTSFQWNRIHVLDVSNPTNAPVVVLPAHVGTTMLVGLDAPYGTNAARSWLTTAAMGNDPGVTLLDLFAFTGNSLAQFQNQIAAEGHLTSGNGLRLGAGLTTYVGAIARGSNDMFVANSYRDVTNELFRVEVHAGSEYAFGRFKWGQDTGATPGLLFYVPGESNITVRRVLESAGGFALSAPTITTFTSAIQRVYFVDEGTNGLGIVQFGDGAVGVRPASDSDELRIAFGLGVGAAGNVVTGVVPLGPGQFALLSGSSNSFSSLQSQVFTKSGSNYVQTSASALPAASSARTRANVWLFSSEPFVNTSPGFIASLSGGDWIDSISGLPGSVSVIAETDRGITNGLGNPTLQNLGSANNAQYGIASQYHPTISLFTYSSPRAAQVIHITISPPPGTYPDPIQISFPGADPTDHISYRIGATGAFQEFGSPFTVSSNAQVQYFATRFGFPEPTPTEIANYIITGGVIPQLNTNTNGGDTNVVPPIVNASNGIPSYIYGTVFYSRRSGSTGSIWSIHLDGSGDHYITDGVRPRLSPEGRYLAFLREGDPFATIPVNNGNIWIRDLLTGTESRLITHTNLIVGFDWEYGTTNLVFDQGCGLFRVGLNGNVQPVPFGADCADDAPLINPVDGNLAFHNLNLGIYVTDPNWTAKQKVPTGNLRPRRPSWSPDGRQLAFAHYQFTYIPESGQDLYVVNPDGSDLFQITGFRTIEGFREGALWTPDGDALIGAATIGGVNGIWLVPLTPDRHACGAPPVRLPTTPGDLIDFVGTVFVPPPPPALTIRREQDEVVVSWRRTAWRDVLESTPGSFPSATWTPVNSPFVITNGMLEYHLPLATSPSVQFFHLRRP